MGDPTESSDFGQRFVPTEIQPTIEQLRIQTSGANTLLVEANAGAAKTTSLALRIAEAWRRGVDPGSIHALTYTETACSALLGALRKIGVPSRVCSSFQVQTFERQSASILDDLFGTVPTLSEAESIAPYIWQAVLNVERNDPHRWRSELVMPNLGDAGFVEEFLRVNALLKGTMRDMLEREDGAADPDYAASIGIDYTQLRVYLAYERIRRQQFAEVPQFRGPGDATYDLACLLSQGDPIRDARSWPRTAKILVADEMHDLNRAMFLVLVDLLNGTPAYFCGVGDVDQVIHEGSGAEARFMSTAIAAYTSRHIERLPLTHSFRFGKSLARMAGRIAKKPYTSLAQHQTHIKWAEYESPAHCAKLTLEEVLAWRRQPKAKMSDFAVLLRHSYQTVDIENELLTAAVPYEVKGFQSYLHRSEILFIRGLLAIATDRLDTVSRPEMRERIMRALLLFASSRIHVEGREEESQQDLLAEAIAMVNDNPHLLGSFFFENQILRTTDPDNRRRLLAAVKAAQDGGARDGVIGEVLRALDIKSMVRSAFATRERRQEALCNLSSLERAAAQVESASYFFDELNQREQRQQEMKTSACVTLGSVVQVKGLEFEHVLLPFLEAGEFPSASAPDRDERNKFYVGVTRARRFLTLLTSATAPSSFALYGRAGSGMEEI